MYAARLAAALKARWTWNCSAWAGRRCVGGVEIVTDYSEFAVVELRNCETPAFLLAGDGAVGGGGGEAAPALAIVTDSGLSFAAGAQAETRTFETYTSPQFWALVAMARELFRRRFAKALCIFPFEREFFFRIAGVRRNSSGIRWSEAVQARKTGNSFCEEAGA